MSVKWSSKINFQDGREFVRIDEVNDGDSSTHEDTETAGHHDEPEAPAEVEHEDGLLQSDEERSRREKFEVDEVAEEEGEASESDEVCAVSWDNNQHQVGENPKSKSHPVIIQMSKIIIIIIATET